MTEYVFARTLLQTDIVSAVISAVVPAVFYLSGRAAPTDVGVTISLWVAATAAIVLTLRLIVAPYVLWKRDQNEIGSLRSVISDTSIKRRQFFEEEFLKDRADLARDLTHYAMVIAPMEAFSAFDADTHLNALTRKAVIHLGDQNFRKYWETFCTAFRNLVQGAKFAHENAQKISVERMSLVRDRFAYDFGAMKAGSTALIFILTENHDHAKVYAEILNDINTKYSHAHSENLKASLWTVA